MSSLAWPPGGIKMFFTFASTHPAITEDRAFFAANPRRRYRARAFQPGEIGFPSNFAMFGSNERGEIGEINLVILKRTKGGRLRYHFSVFADPQLNTDLQIEAFLRSRGIAPLRHDGRGECS